MLVFHRAPPIRARGMDVSSTQPTAHFSLRLDTHNSFCQTLRQSMAAGGESLEAPKAERQQHTADRTGDDRDTQQARESHG